MRSLARAAGVVGVAVLTALSALAGPARAEAQWRPPDAIEGWPAPPAASARAYLVADEDTGQVLAARQPDQLLPVASTVKVLTVLTALRELSLDQVVTVGQEVTIGGAGVGLAPGDQWTVAQLVDAVLVRSGNDAAYALAAAASGGDVEAFTARMEDVAAELGAPGVVITEPTGLDDENRLSARQLATLARAALDDPVLAASAAQRSVVLPGLGDQPTRNLLLDQYAGADGLKTGYTDLSGYSLVGSATREEGSLVGVVLGARGEQDRFDEVAALFDLAYEHLAVTSFGPLRLRRAGAWEPTDAPVRAWHPRGTTATVGLAGDAASRTAVVRMGDHRLAVTELPADTPPADAASVGTALADALYRSMRQAHAVGAWTAAGTEGADAGSEDVG